MLFKATVLISLFFLENAYGLKCWKCDESSSNWECNAKGHLQECDVNEGSCENEVRVDKQYDTVVFRRVVVGKLIRIKKGCKQTVACRNNQGQNDRTVYGTAKWDLGQCDFSPLNTVCRCCCESDGCNYFPLYCRPLSLDRMISYSFNRPDDQGAAPKVHPCDQESNPCGNGGRCVKLANMKYSCNCLAAWRGDDYCNTPTRGYTALTPEEIAEAREAVLTEQQNARAASRQTRVCIDYNPCGNGAECQVGARGSYTCLCAPGWQDSHCNTPVGK